MLGMTETILDEQVVPDAIGAAFERARELLDESVEEAPQFLERARAALNELEGALGKPHCGAAAYGESFNLAVLSLAALALIAQSDACGDLD